MRIAIVSYRYNLAIGSMTNSFLWLLAEKGHYVDVYIDKASYNYCNSSLSHERITWRIFQDIPQENFYDRVLAKVDWLDSLGQILPMRVSAAIFSRALCCFSEWLRRAFNTQHYDMFVAVEARALASMYWYTGAKLVYLNMELLGWEEDVWVFPHKQLLKHIECKMLDRVQQVLITSSLRGDIFSRINNFPREKVIDLPVVPMRGNVNFSSQFFHEKFDIPPTKRIVLYAGHIARWAKCDEIIRSVAAWPKDCVLVMHTWSKDNIPSDYLLELQGIAKGLPVHFSFESIPYEHISDAWASATIGLAFYDEIDSNFIEILFSSNKIGEYLKAGLPIVCSNLPSLKAFVETHQIGQSVNVKELPDAIASILSTYKDYRKKVASCHEELFVFEKYFERIYPSLQGVMAENEKNPMA